MAQEFAAFFTFVCSLCRQAEFETENELAASLSLDLPVVRTAAAARSAVRGVASEGAEASAAAVDSPATMMTRQGDI